MIVVAVFDWNVISFVTLYVCTTSEKKGEQFEFSESLNDKTAAELQKFFHHAYVVHNITDGQTKRVIFNIIYSDEKNKANFFGS